MMRITEFSNPRMAQAFVDYMATRGIQLRVEHDNHHTVWLDDDSKVNLVENELSQFYSRPEPPALSGGELAFRQHLVRHSLSGLFTVGQYP